MNQQERIRRMLQERLGFIGVAPDVRNDATAVRAVAKQLNVDLEEVVEQLVRMRTEQNVQMARRMGQASLSPGALTLLAASRDSLMCDESFTETFSRRVEQGPVELVRALGSALPRPRVVAV